MKGNESSKSKFGIMETMVTIPGTFETGVVWNLWSRKRGKDNTRLFTPSLPYLGTYGSGTLVPGSR